MELSRAELVKRARTVTGWRVVHEDALVKLAEAWGLEVKPASLPARLDLAGAAVVARDKPDGPHWAVATVSNDGYPVMEAAIALYNADRAMTEPRPIVAGKPLEPAWKVTFFAGTSREETTVYTETADEAAQVVRQAYPGCFVNKAVKVG